MKFILSRFYIIATLLVFAGSIAAQDDTWTAPKITDNMTTNPEQNQKWRMGEFRYSAKPKNMWELGIHAGHYFITGDVDSRVPGGFGVGVHLRKAIHYVFSLRGELTYGVSKGLDPQLTLQAVAAQDLNGTSASGKHGNLYRNYKNQDINTQLQGVLNIGNILFHRERNKWNWYINAGIGLNFNTTKIDALKGNSAYDFSSVSGNVDTRSGRKAIKKKIKSILDGDYETEARKQVAVFRLGDKTNVHPLFSVGTGIARKLSKRVNLALEHEVLTSGNDLLDGFVYRSVEDQSNNNDVAHYTSLRLGINLGSFEKKTEPLYWLNPLDGVLHDLTELKQRPILDLTDVDGDGVIDMVDEEKNSPTGALVDTKGVALDSDKDGVPDHVDRERFSPPGFSIDAQGVAEMGGGKGLTEDEVINLINQRISSIKTDWFLPMIHFDLDKYYIKPEFYGQLHHVATVMKSHPDLKVAVVGHTDVRNPDDYNKVLAYKRADAAISYLMSKYSLPRDRFLIQYGGESMPMVPGLPDSHQISKQDEMSQYINRRVEFRIAVSGDQDMERPAGPDAGKNTPGSSRTGPKYSGNLNSGY